MSAFAYWAATAGYRNDEWRKRLVMGPDKQPVKIVPLEPSPSVSGFVPVPKQRNTEDSYTKKKMMKELWIAMGEDATLFEYLCTDMGLKKLWKLQIKIIEDITDDY